MKKTTLFFWLSTGFIFLFEGVMPALTGNSELAVEGVRHLGYPDYFRIMLTCFKVAGALALVLPMTPVKLREWAYAGFTFNFIAAAVSHWAVDGFGGQTIFPLVMIAILAVSYVQRQKLSAAQDTSTLILKSV